MSSLSTWLWGTSQLDDAVDKATSELLPAGAEDIALNLEICDQIRSKSVPAKDAMRALKRRLNHKNPNVQILALALTDICVKNGGDYFLGEVASREFIDNLVSILKVPALNHDVKNSILRHIQNWAIAFEGKSNLAYVGQVYKNLQREGYNFPPRDLAVANSAMVDTQTAPEWIDSDVCLRCRTAFTFTNRKHHCRNCGQVFDQQCSSKSMALPHFGITQDVRVCDGCYNKLHRKSERSDKGHRHHSSKHNRLQRDFDDADLQRAIQLSLKEIGAAGHSRPGYVPAQPSEPPLVDKRVPSCQADEEDDPELRAAIEASLREANAPRASAPVDDEPTRAEQPAYGYGLTHTPTESYAPPFVPPPRPIPTHDLGILEEDAILTFNQTVDQIQAQGIRDLSRFPGVTELYDKASTLRPKLALSLDDAGRKEQLLSEMHANLSEAVKLYDQILTEQIARPRWRTAQQAQYYPQSPVQQTHDTSSQPYQPAHTYSQWAQSPVTSNPLPSHSPQQPSYVPSEYRPATTSPITQPPTTNAIQQPAFSQPLSQPTYQTLVSLPPQQHAPYQPETPAVAAFPPPPSRQNTLVSTPPQPFVDTSAQPQPQAQVQVQSPLQPQPQGLPRAQPIQTPASPSPPQQLRQQPQFTPQPQPQVQVSQFPVAPTSAPTSYGMYGPTAPTGMPIQEERKEALLIDL